MGIMMRRLALVPLIVVLVTPAVVEPARPLAHRETLPNGIILLVAQRPAVPIVVARVFTRAGAVLDPPGKEGLANLTGALLTRGTAKRTGPEIDSAIEFVGGGLDAGAGRDGLGASMSVLKKDIGLGLDLLAEIVRSPSFPEAELKRKVGEIQAAIKRSEESPDTVAARALAKLVYPGHPYATPAEGTRESVAGLTRDDVVGFYQRWVRPDTAIIAVVGAITVDEARREVLTRFGDWRPPAAPPPSIPMAQPGGGTREDRITRDLTQSTILFGRQGIRQTDPDYFPLAVASYILGGGSTGRLYGRVRDQGGLAYSVYSYLNPGRFGASIILGAQTRTAEVPTVIDLIRQEAQRIGREPVRDHELDLAKSYLIGSFPLRLDTTRKVSDFIVSVEEQGLGLDYPDRYLEQIRRVTVADVQRVAAKYFAPDTFNLVVVGGKVE
jgi:zinc protease